MDVSIEKLSLIQKILLIEDSNLLNTISKLIEKERKSSREVGGWEEVPARQKEIIEASIKELEEGKGIPLDEVLTKFRKRYRS